MIDINEIELIFKFCDDNEAPAKVALDFGSFQIRGFVIRKTKFDENKNRFYVSPPSIRTGKGGWVKIFFADNKNWWRKLENKILTEFDESHNNELLKELTK